MPSLPWIIVIGGSPERRHDVARRLAEEGYAVDSVADKYLAHGLLTGETAPDPRTAAQPGFSLDHLSTREREVLLAFRRCLCVMDVADELHISVHTVKNHLKAIYRKLEVHSQIELIGLFADDS
ncbi:MAG: helix-turn-helix transcriptional regulator [Myxococcales bacterium]|nr:helix-turn-helix transcriptional regulator [Myxococcales bacterium]